MLTRKNQSVLTPDEWKTFIDAVNKMHGMGIPTPRYRDFVKVHTQAMDPHNPAGMAWGVHTMGRMMQGRNFLAWHRRFVWQFEQRLRKVHPDVTVPYWDAITDRTLPQGLSDPALLRLWGVTRNWDPSQLPTAAELHTLSTLTTFTTFQSALEATVHADVHNAVGGDMAGSSSPSDPLFFLHHANIDRLWAAWQAAHPGQNPPNASERLKPVPLFGVQVAGVLDITQLGYAYQ